VKYVSRVPQPPMDQLVDDLYYLEGNPPGVLATEAAADAETWRCKGFVRRVH